MEDKKIVFIASECQPFFASGGLGDVIGSLPQKIASASEATVSVILPLYSKINPAWRNKLLYVGQMTVQLAWRKQYCGIFKYEAKDVTYYFLDNEYYFKRSNFYGYFDDGERFAFFAKAGLDAILYLNLKPNIVHCHDWQTGLVPVYRRTHYGDNPVFARTKFVFTIHNIEYQGIFANDWDVLEDTFGISRFDSHLLEYKGSINIMKGAMETSHIVTTVSPTYAKEILSPEYAHGLEYEVERVKHKLVGILNGIDKNFYSPSKDKALFVNYNSKSVENKVENKIELQKMLNLPVDKSIPLIGMVTRLVAHKGLDLVKGMIEELLIEKVQIVMLGTGDIHFEGYFKDLENKFGSKLRVIIAYNPDLSRKIYGASDIFLMPSKAEPCGLAQMIASRYGSIPIVRETGGLADSIKDFSGENGNGYTFAEYSSGALLSTLRRALNDYQNPDDWMKKVHTVMETDFGWTKSAKEYLKMYEQVLKQ
ncbi:MAG: glycogen synthase [Bacilli bacterium]|jgi:starch synthase